MVLGKYEGSFTPVRFVDDCCGGAKHVYDMQQIKRHFATRQSENTDFLLCQIQAVFHVYYADRGAYLKF